MTIACGSCTGCRLERSRQWAVRIMHEASTYEDNVFITLTYAPEHLPEDRSLDVTHFQKFMKRLRGEIAPRKIRFYHCGEYGDNKGSIELGRPHYHSIIFNYSFPDKTKWIERNGEQTYKSEQLERLWPYGISELGTVTTQSAAYVARYIMKKINGRRADNHYLEIKTGVIRRPPYTTMSTRPGIGKAWIDKWMTDVYPNDLVVNQGKRARPPKYYDRQYEIINPAGYKKVKAEREKKGYKHRMDNTPSRLAIKSDYLEETTKHLKREL